MTVYVGTSGWSYDHWEGVLYPPGLPARERLDVYLSRCRVTVNRRGRNLMLSVCMEKQLSTVRLLPWQPRTGAEQTRRFQHGE